MAHKVHLQRKWVVGDQIGQGGFGRVFSATGPNGEHAVLKLIPKAPGADRELLFVDIKGARNIVPIIDSGDVGTNWAIVMPRAERSLRSHLDAAKGPLTPSEVIAIISDIATALVDLTGRVVHRDLKPENVLLLNTTWSLSDFGISRYAEATTAPNTQKFALSSPYAAPERWRNERATIATDVYSLGIIAFELLTAKRPFPGPHAHDFREQHLHSEPPHLDLGPIALRALISECLYKAPGARPSPANIASRLQSIEMKPSGGGLARLSQANLAEVSRRSEAERIASERQSATEMRRELLKAATQTLASIEHALVHAVENAAPAITRQRGKHGGTMLSLGSAQLEISPAFETGLNPWQWTPPAFNVIAHSQIIVRIPRNRYDYEGRSHSLWFCDATEEGRFQWFETAFMVMPLINKTTSIRPFAADPGATSAKALGNGVAEFQLAWPLEPLDIGDLNKFVDRWANWFADAAEGILSAPSTMPERPTPRSWRQK